jgi:hypothetical protein
MQAHLTIFGAAGFSRLRSSGKLTLIPHPPAYLPADAT